MATLGLNIVHTFVLEDCGTAPSVELLHGTVKKGYQSRTLDSVSTLSV